MGYKLAGYSVIGNCEIDPGLARIYTQNLHPKYSFQMDIREFNNKEDFPEELKNLDILDGSPPCSTFSMLGQREQAWGAEKKFREGQALQRLDDLFLHFIRTAEILQPKVIVAENVTGILKKNAKGYVNEICNDMKKAGYVLQIFKLNSACMGVPQYRERVFFIAHRKDLFYPPLRLEFDEPIIRFGDVRSAHGRELRDGTIKELVKRRKPSDKCVADISKRIRGKETGYSVTMVHDADIAPCTTAQSIQLRYIDGKKYAKQDLVNIQTFPQDYEFADQSVTFVCGMSVPPVMMANIASEIYTQWFC